LPLQKNDETAGRQELWVSAHIQQTQNNRHLRGKRQVGFTHKQLDDFGCKLEIFKLFNDALSTLGLWDCIFLVFMIYCRLSGGCRPFRGTYCSHFQSRRTSLWSSYSICVTTLWL